MKNSEREFTDKIVAMAKEGADGEKYIELPGPVLNPYMYKMHKKEIAAAAGISVGELSKLMQGESVLDTATGEILPQKAYEAGGDVLALSVAVEWLLKKNSPRTVESYIINELPVHNDAELYDWYLRILNRIFRYNKLLELGAPQVIIHNEWCMLQKTVVKTLKY